MSTSVRFHSIIISFTVLIMFWAITFLAPVVKTIEFKYQILSSICAIPTAFGTYSFLAQALANIMRKHIWLRKYIFGSSYIAGTWVGWFRGHRGNFRYIVELYEQDFDSLIIRGRSYNADKTAHGQWESESVSLEPRVGVVVFTYSFDVISQSSSLRGISKFQFERESESSPPKTLAGFSHDLNDRTRIPVHEEKISDVNMNWAEALEIAVARFKNV